MNVRIKLYDTTFGEIRSDLSRHARTFIQNIGGRASDTDCVCAYHRDNLIGFFCYSVCCSVCVRHWDHSTGITAYGTYVERAYRRQRVAARMWKHAVGINDGVTCVSVAAATRAGAGFTRFEMSGLNDMGVQTNRVDLRKE